MFNVLIFFISVIVYLLAVVIIYKIFGKMGIFAFIAFATILANLQVTKSIELFGLNTTAGNVLYASTFLSTDILSEKYGKKEAGKAVLLGICVTILWLIGTQLTLLFQPSDIDTAHESLKAIFSTAPRICLASLLGYAFSQSIDVVLYHALWKKTGNTKKGLWIRNNASTLTSQLIDSVIFVTIAFLGTVPIQAFFEILLTTYLFKAIVALLDTPFAYLANKIIPLEERKNQICPEIERN